MFKPMLAGKAGADIKFPVYASPKLDGIRCIVTNKGPMSRQLLPIPNTSMFYLWNSPILHRMDGEIIVGDPVHPNAMQNTTSQVMSRNNGVKGARFHVFDVVDDWKAPAMSFEQRYSFIQNWAGIRKDALNQLQVTVVEQTLIHTMEELAKYEAKAVELGFEGVMIRDPKSKYKFGRSGTKEGILLKIKRWEDTEGVVVGFEEQEHNGNAAEKDKLGRTKRSTAKAGKSGAGKLGALVLKCETFPDIEVRVGTGFSDDQRVEYWNFQDGLMGETVTFKYQPAGVLNGPRFPVFKSFRKD